MLYSLNSLRHLSTPNLMPSGDPSRSGATCVLEPRCPWELQSHTSFLPLSSKIRFQLPPLHSLSPYTHISPGIYHLIPLAQRPIQSSETFFMSFFFFNAISPLMVPRQAASHINYKLSVYMWESSHQGQRPRSPCPFLSLEGQKPCMEAPKAPC